MAGVGEGAFVLRGRARGASLAAVLVLAATVLGMKAAVASTGTNFVVNSTSDAVDANVGDGACATAEGECTLRAAIQETNALPGADTILVPAGLYALEIPPLNQNLADNGDLDITDSTRSPGPAPARPPSTGGRRRRVARPGCTGSIASSRSWPTAARSPSQDSPFSDGYAAEYGGAVMNNSTATVTVAASDLTGNVADKVGGAIDNHLGGAVHVQDSTLSNNVSFESGSALNNNRDGTLTVTNSTILSNSAADVALDEAVLGSGAIANNAELDSRGTITVTGSQVVDNAAGGSRVGAALSNDGAGTVIVDQTTFSKNRSEVDGGAIFNGAGEVTVTRSTFNENAGENGGAIFNSTKDGRMTVSGSTFTLNTAAVRSRTRARGP
jgi:CSLREA domain-containing protein